MAKALYRKYRSKSLGEIFGQGHVTEVLKKALEQGRIAHAYLLTGPRGVGKTSIARILAHDINQLPYTDSSQHLDIIEIDAASNNGVEDVRDLREKVQIAPISALKKVYIIDEVHMLSKAAFNALLKTLEEPPEHVVFILATTDVEKLPATIISRTQRFSLKAISLEDIVKHLKYIAKEEKLKVDDDAIGLIAKRGDGSFRDSISLLDQLSSLAGKDGVITLALVEEALGLAPHEQVKKLLAAYEAKDLAGIVALLNENEAAGVQPGVLTDQLLNEIRAQLFEKPQLLPLMDALLEVPRSSQPGLKLLTVLAQHGGKVKNAALSAPGASVSASVGELRKAPSSSLSPSASRQHAKLLQVNGVENSLYSAELPIGQTSSNSQESPTPLTGQFDSVPLEADGSALHLSSRSPSRFKETKSEEQPNISPVEPEGMMARNGLLETGGRKGEQNSRQSSEGQNGTLTEIDWPRLVEYTREHYVAIYSVLSKCGYEIIDGGLTIYTGNAFYKKKLDDTKYRVNLTKSLIELGVGDVTITTIPTPPPPKDSLAASVAAIMGGGEEVSVGEEVTAS